MNPRTAVILGGGVTGLSTAYHLARMNYGKVVVLDIGAVGNGSSSRAAGIVTGLLWSDTGVAARKKSLELFREFSTDLPGYCFRDVACLNLFDPSTWPDRKALLPMYDRLGAPYEVLSPAEIQRRWPLLRPEPDFVGLLDPLGGYSEPDEYLPALAARVRELGVEIREHEPATGFLDKNGSVVGVETAAGEIHADAVVSTVYAWTELLLARLGLRLPVKAFVHQRYVSRPVAELVALPAINAAMLGGYVRPAAGNRLLGGIETPRREEQRVDSFDFRYSSLQADRALAGQWKRNFESLLPLCSGIEWEFEKIGLLTFSMDGEPVLGPVREAPGLFVGVGFHSGGFAYSPVSGMLLAEYVAAGKTSIDVTAFSPNRFDAAETASYLATTLLQETCVPRRH
ncbi:MAG: FAD-binding oxidoreductase [Acidobacteria bacterium]|nr:FAD-binding oxidoreductase [Acidobacteriota bacterium]